MGLVTLLAACSTNQRATVPATAELMPLNVVSWWNENRNVGDVAGAMNLLADDAVVLDFEFGQADDRAAFAETLEAQAVAGWQVVDHDCASRRGDRDVPLSHGRHGPAPIGPGTGRDAPVHGRDGRIRRAFRTHDAQSAAGVYDALDQFRRWVAERRPDLVEVISATPGAAAYSTVEGARAMVSLLDEYDAWSNRRG